MIQLVMYYQYMPVNQTQSSDTSDDPFKLINAVKNNDRIIAVNTVNEKVNTKYIDNIDENEWTALHWACYYGYEKMVKLLTENNANLDIKTGEGLGDDPEFKHKKSKRNCKLKRS